MKTFLAMVTTVAMSVVLVMAIVQAAHGNPWLLVAGAAAFVSMIGYFGCRAH